jgi:hypothetical protein
MMIQISHHGTQRTQPDIASTGSIPDHMSTAPDLGRSAIWTASKTTRSCATEHQDLSPWFLAHRRSRQSRLQIITSHTWHGRPYTRSRALKPVFIHFRAGSSHADSDD